MDNLEKEVLDLRKQLKNEKEINRALQIIRENYEKKYGIRIFANGVEKNLKED